MPTESKNLNVKKETIKMLEENIQYFLKIPGVGELSRCDTKLRTHKRKE